MRTRTQSVAGTNVRVHVLERRADLEAFEAFLSRCDDVLALDTETSGPDVHAADHRLLAVQFGTVREAWVLPCDQFADDIGRVLRRPRQFVTHGAPEHRLALDRHLGVRLRELAQVLDIRILAHLLDPGDDSEGRVGLDRLAAKYLGNEVPSVARQSSDLGVVLVARLHDALRPRLRARQMRHLVRFEHDVQRVLAGVQKRGMRVDVGYVEELREELLVEREQFARVAGRYGVTSPGSGRQLAEALEGMGVVLEERTPSGEARLDDDVLRPLADLDPQWQRLSRRTPNRLADAVLRVRRVDTWVATYLKPFLELRGFDGRLHPRINGLGARTGRMTVSRPALQSAPADGRLRRAFLADPGCVIVSCDFAQVELRVLAGLCEDERMTKALWSGEDPYAVIAECMFGKPITSPERQIAKQLVLARMYGSGVDNLVRATGALPDEVQRALDRQDETFPSARRYEERLRRQAKKNLEVITPRGRRLPVDAGRPHTAINYMVQSCAADLLKEAILELERSRLDGYLMLPVHDELVVEVPAIDAEELSIVLQDIMTTTFRDVPIVARVKVGGRSWGSLYDAPDEASSNGLCA